MVEGHLSVGLRQPAVENRQRDVMEQLDCAEAAFKSLGNRLSQFLSRLEPASHPQAPRATSGAIASERPVQSPIGQRLANLARCLEELETDINIAGQLLQL